MLTVAILAERWNVSESLVYTMIRRGELRAVKIGGSIRVRVADVEAYERARETVASRGRRNVQRPSGDGGDELAAVLVAARAATWAAARATLFPGC